MASKSIKTLFDVQLATKLDIDDLETHDEIINVNISLAIVYLSSLIAPLTLHGLHKKPIEKEAIIKTLSKALTHVLLICEACYFVVPEEDEVEEFQKEVPIEVKNDSILSIMGMIGALADLAHVINVDLNEPVWVGQEVPTEFEDDIYTFLAGIVNIGNKFKFELYDVISLVGY